MLLFEIKKEFKMDIRSYYESCKKLIEEHGYFIQGVGPDPNNNESHYMYTVGRELIGKFDFLLINNNNASILNDIVKQFDMNVSSNYSLNSQSSLIIELDTFTVNGKRARFLLKKVCPDKLRNVCLGCWNSNVGVSKPIGFYQVFYSDNRNILPNENFFNEDYNQLDYTLSKNF